MLTDRVEIETLQRACSLICVNKHRAFASKPPDLIAATVLPALLLCISITMSLNPLNAHASDTSAIPIVTPWDQSIGLNSDQSSEVHPLLAKAEQFASESVILESNPDFFGTMSPQLIRGIAERIDDFDVSAKHKVQKQVISFLEEEMAKVRSNEATRLQADLSELNSALDVARQQYALKKQPILEPDAENTLITDSSTEDISLYEAAMIIEKKGVNPYRKEARRYYCELGFTGLDTMGVYYVSFC